MAGKIHDTIAALRYFRVVRGQDQRLPGLCQTQHPAEDQIPRGTVLLGGRLIRDQHGGLRGQGPGDRHPLLLAAGQLVGQLPGVLSQA